jgi:nucleotide-binding universal stress UspA family protein
MTASTVLLCSDGSDVGLRALSAGLALLGSAERPVIATVIEQVDPYMVLGTGFAAGVATPEEAEQIRRDRLAAADDSLCQVRAKLGLPAAERVVLENDAPGPALCDLAASLAASVMVIGTHGHGGLRRAVLGSVSDHIVRHAPCPVVVTAME